MRYIRTFFLLLGMWLFTLVICSQDLKITKVGEWSSGQYRDIFVLGSYAYCAAADSGLHIIDISDASKPQKIGHYDTHNNAIGVYTSGNYAYVLEEERGLLILDVSSPRAPNRVGFYSNLNLSPFKGHLHVVGKYAYIVDLDGLHVIDVSTPSIPFRVGYYQLKGMSGIVVNDGRAYAPHEFGFYIFDVSNPFQPELTGTYENKDFEDIGEIFISGHYAYLIGRAANQIQFGFQVIDISNPAAPNQVGSIVRGGSRSWIYVKGNYAYVSAAGPTNDFDVVSTVEVYDISNPATPTYKGTSASYYGSLSDIFVKDNYVYAANVYTGLQIFDVSDPLSPGLTGNYKTIKRFEDIYVSGQYAFGADWYTGLVVLDISNPSHPVWVGDLDTPGNANGIFVKGNYAYVADYYEGLQVIDISESTAPTLMGNFKGVASSGVFVKDKLAYLADGTGGLKIIDVSNPSAPSLLGGYHTEGWAANVFVSGNYAYLAESMSSGRYTETGGGFKIFDVSMPSAPVLVGEIPGEIIHTARDVYVNGAYAYVAESWGYLNIIDISVPSAPSLVGHYQGTDNPHITGIDYSGNYVYLASGSTGLQMIDISSPSQPQFASVYSNIEEASAVFVSGNYIYVTDRENGKLYILQTSSVSQTAQLILSRSHLYFGSGGNGISTGTQTLFVGNSGEGEMEWSVSPGQEWLKCAPTSGTNSGELFVSVDATGLSPGTYHGALSVSSPQATNSPQAVAVTLKVYKKGKTAMPFGSFATPLEGSVVTGSTAVTGWVLDDIGIHHVKIYHEEGSSLVYIGDAVMVEGARPDVELAYPNYPQNDRAGWGYMLLTNFLPAEGNGTCSLHAIATDFEGHQVTLGVKTIYCDNINAVKPFGAIDTPAQGGIAAGSEYVNFGWALTPLPNTIPKDGSTITVWVDGTAVGHPVYNRYREDIASLFPGYNNSDGAGGHFYLDTTPYENGVHTIAWSVTDDAGNTDGIGSRYFTIQNSGGTASGKAQSPERTTSSVSGRVPGISQIPIDYSNPVQVIKGYNQNIQPQIIYPDESGDITIEINELQRVEIHFNRVPSPRGLSGGTRGLAPLSNSSESSTSVPDGCLLIGDRLAALPIGSFLDSKNGIFSWQPGPGYLGDHELVFIEKIRDEVRQKFITVRIRPKFE